MRKFTKAIAVLSAMIGSANVASAQNYSLSLNGSTSYGDIGTSIGNGVRTIEMWFKPNSTIDSASMVAAGDYIALIARNDNTQNSEFGLYFSNAANHKGQLAFFIQISGVLTQIYSNSHSWSSGTWYHVAGVIDGSTGMKMYVNCSVQSSTAPGQTSAVQTSSEITAIGRWGNFSGRYFHGYIENTRLWTTAVASSNLCVECGGPTYTTGLVGDFHFDEGSGSALINAGSAGNGTQNNCSWVINSPCTYVLDYDGSNDYVDLGSSLGTNAIRTIELWFKTPVTIDSASMVAAGDYIALVARNDNTQNKEFGLYFSNDANHKGQLAFFVQISGVLTQVYSNSHSWTGGTWYHVAGVIDGSTGMKIYINGSLQSSTAAGQTAAVQSSSEITALGRWGNFNGRYFHGRMENVRFWSSARTATEISNNQCAEPTTTNLIAYYKFNEGAGTTIKDETNTYNGTAVNGPTWVGDAPCAGWYPRLTHQNPENYSGTSTSPLDFNLYPNPTNSQLNLETNQVGKVHVCIYDMFGDLVFAAACESKSTIDVTGFAKGIYLIIVSDENGFTRSGKFIKE